MTAIGAKAIFFYITIGYCLPRSSIIRTVYVLMID